MGAELRPEEKSAKELFRLDFETVSFTTLEALVCPVKAGRPFMSFPLL